MGGKKLKCYHKKKCQSSTRLIVTPCDNYTPPDLPTSLVVSLPRSIFMKSKVDNVDVLQRRCAQAKSIPTGRCCDSYYIIVHMPCIILTVYMYFHSK